jgi:transaldolase
MTRLHRLHTEYGQSPWLDNLTRDSLEDGSLQDLIHAGIRGVTANPSIFAHAMSSSDAYTEQLNGLLQAGTPLEDAYWELVVTDITRAADLFAPLYETCGGGDGFVSVEVSPEVADDTAATIDAARHLHQRIDRANLMVKIPGHRRRDSGHRSDDRRRSQHQHHTDLFPHPLQPGNRRLHVGPGEPPRPRTRPHPDAQCGLLLRQPSRHRSRPPSRSDRPRPDRRTKGLGCCGAGPTRLPDIPNPVRQPTVAEARRGRGTSAATPVGIYLDQGPDYPDTKYVDALIGPDTVTTLTESTIDIFEHHGTVARTIDRATPEPADTLSRLQGAGIDLDEVGAVLEINGIEHFQADQQAALDALQAAVRQKSASATNR